MRKSFYFIDLNKVTELMNESKTIYYRRLGYPPKITNKKGVINMMYNKFFVDVFGTTIYIFEI